MTLAADALLDQDVFAGVSNIIKNEVLHRIGLHPESILGALPARKLGEHAAPQSAKIAAPAPTACVAQWFATT